MREVGPQLLKPVRDLDPLVDVVSPLTPVLAPSLPWPGPTLRGRWPSTSPKVAAAIGSWAFRAVTSSLDPRMPTSTTFTTPGGLLKMYSYSAGELSPTSSIRSKSGSDNTASRSSAGGSRLKGEEREKGTNR